MSSPTDLKQRFSRNSALATFLAAEDVWNSRKTIAESLSGKWNNELEYRLMKKMWSFTENRISVRFEYEWHDASKQWFRTHGNEHWRFDEEGLMRRRDMSTNVVPILEKQRRV